MLCATHGVRPMFIERRLITGLLIGEDGPALVDQPTIPDVLEKVVEVLLALRKRIKGGSDRGNVGRPPVEPEGHQNRDDDEKAEHPMILA